MSTESFEKFTTLLLFFRSRKQTMKGNRGLEALAALCGDESKAVAAAERSSEASTNSSDRNQNNKSTDNETIAGVPGTMTSTFGAGTQQPNPTNAFTNVDMNTSNLLGQLTPQQLLTTAASIRPGGMIDPKVSQSLLLSAGMAANQQQQNPAHVLQQYVQAQAAQQQQAAQAAIYQQVTAAATAMLQSNPQAALLATMASLAQAGNNGNSNIEPKPQASLPGVGIQSRIGASTNNSKETKAPAPSTSTGAVISSSNSIDGLLTCFKNYVILNHLTNLRFSPSSFFNFFLLTLAYYFYFYSRDSARFFRKNNARANSQTIL